MAAAEIALDTRLKTALRESGREVAQFQRLASGRALAGQIEIRRGVQGLHPVLARLARKDRAARAPARAARISTPRPGRTEAPRTACPRGVGSRAGQAELGARIFPIPTPAKPERVKGLCEFLDRKVDSLSGPSRPARPRRDLAPFGPSPFRRDFAAPDPCRRPAFGRRRQIPVRTRLARIFAPSALCPSRTELAQFQSAFRGFPVSQGRGGA